MALVAAPMAQARGVKFMLVSGSHIGDQIASDGGPNVPASLNGGRVSGVLAPQSGGPGYLFRGRFKTGARRASVADQTSASAIPWLLVPPGPVPLAVKSISTAIALEESGELSKAVTMLGHARNSLRTARDNGELTESEYNRADAALAKARSEDDFALSLGDGHPRLRADSVITAISFKRRALRTIDGTEPNPFEPAFTPGGIVPLTLGFGSGIATTGNGFLGTDFTIPSSSTGWLANPSGGVSNGPPGSVFETFGPHNTIGGAFDGRPAIFSIPNFTPTLLPMQPGFTGGEIRSADDGYMVGYESSPSAEEVALAYGSQRSGVGLIPPPAFSGGAGFFAVNGSTAYGDHFDQGEQGTFQPFRFDLRSRKVTPLWRPPGGSSQPTAANGVGMAVGTSQTAGGTLLPTIWWGQRHYALLPGDAFIGLNDQGAIVGSANGDAAVFVGGQAMDLNDLLPPSSGWRLTQANAITDNNVVVGTGTKNGVRRGFALALNPQRLFKAPR